MRAAEIPSKVAFKLGMWGQVKGENECWNYVGSTVAGYGRIKCQGKIYYTHRISYAITHGEIADDLDCLHHCDNPACFNPKHLFLGTQADNMRDMWRKGRANIPQGVNNYAAKLTEKQVRAICKTYDSGTLNQYELAARYNVSQSVISRIVRGIIYRNVTVEL
jgi:hypothetical protein